MNWYQYILLELDGANWLASNILLLASKKCFLSSQGLVGAGMNCRALHRESDKKQITHAE
jgi:hypothetical protein